MKVGSFAIRTLAAALAIGAGISQAHAAGYEKSIMWGGRPAGFAGIATPYSQGSESLYWNPAGLVSDRVGQDLSFNVSPVWSQFKGPFNNANEEATSSQSLTTPFGLIYGNTVNETWGFGVGGYVSGGSSAKFDDINFPGVAAGMDVETNLRIVELAAGAAYKVSDAFRLGVSARMVFASADFAIIQRTGVLPGPASALGNTVANVKLTGLKDTTPGFAIGGQYRLSEQTALGFRYRSEIELSASGDVGGNLHTQNGGVVPFVTNAATAKTSFPQQFTLGAQHAFNEMWTGLAEYAWTNYAKVSTIDVTGTIGTSTTTLANGTQVRQDWKDQHNVRLAGQYGGFSWPLRFGYGWTSQVTNSDFARPSFAPPAAAHTLTLGTGTNMSVMEAPLTFDAGFEYTWSQGEGNPGGAQAGNPAGDFRKGDFSVKSYALHLGVGYAF